MIERTFADEDSTLCVRFNGWLFEGYDDAKAVLIETIVAELLKKRSTLAKVKEKAGDVLQSINWFKVARTLGGAALSFYAGMPQGDILQGVSKVAENVIADPQSVLTGDMLKKSSTVPRNTSRPTSRKTPPRIACISSARIFRICSMSPGSTVLSCWSTILTGVSQRRR